MTELFDLQILCLGHYVVRVRPLLNWYWLECLNLGANEHSRTSLVGIWLVGIPDKTNKFCWSLGVGISEILL